MKKEILLLTLLILFSTLVSASLFTGVWQEYLTGKQVSEISQSKAILIIVDKEYSLNVGEYVVVNGNVILLKNVGSIGSVVINIKFTSKQVISIGDTKIIKDIRITNNDAFYSSMPEIQMPHANIIINGNEYDLDRNESVIVNDKIIRLENVGSTRAIIVNVESITDETIPLGDTKIVSDIEITNKETFYVSKTTTPIIVEKIPSEETPIEVIIPLEPVEIIPVEEVSPEGVVIPTEPVKIIPTQVCNGCLVGDVCVPFGLRKDGAYCDIGGKLLTQKELKQTCENDYECKSDECSNGECISTAGLLQKILDFLNRIFG